MHTIVVGPHGELVEVQIRTIEMDRIAETGVASHYMYKAGDTAKSQPQLLFSNWLDEFLDSQDPVGDSGLFMEHLRAEMYPDKLFIFTPKGEIRHLPVGATAVDFAYAVHSHVGNSCAGATVDGHQVPLNTVLESGNRVEIITSRDGRPIPTWLNFVVTAKARTAIRHFLSQQQDKEAVSMGRRLLTKALRDSGFTGKRISDADKAEMLKLFDIKSWQKLLSEIGFGRRLPLMVAQQLISLNQLDVSPKKHKKSAPLSIRGAEKLLINYASCCCPVPGDQIVGVFAPGKGLVVHREGCPNTRRYRKRADQWLHLDWSAQPDERFRSKLAMDARNEQGVLAGVSQIIAKAGSNILKVNVNEVDSAYSVMDFEINVKNKRHLKSIIKALEDNPSIDRVTRVKA